jgi:hypothetical protein
MMGSFVGISDGNDWLMFAESQRTLASSDIRLRRMGYWTATRQTNTCARIENQRIRLIIHWQREREGFRQAVGCCGRVCSGLKHITG